MIRRLILLLPLPLVLAGCMVPTGRTPADILQDPNVRIVHSGFDQLSDPASMKETRGTGDYLKNRRKEEAIRRMNAAHGWCIGLASFSGPDRLAQARRLAAEQKLEKAQFAEREGMVEILVGKFDHPEDVDAVRAVRKWQQIEKDRTHPFGAAVLRPRPSALAPDGDPLDARQFPGHAALLVAFYNGEFKGDWRKEAKRVAAVLRKEGPDGKGGVEALYRINEERKEASVVVGLFTHHDDWRKRREVNPKTNQSFFVEAPGPEIEGLQARFPHLLRNNRKIALPADQTGGVGPSYEAASLVELN